MAVGSFRSVVFRPSAISPSVDRQYHGGYALFHRKREREVRLAG